MIYLVIFSFLISGRRKIHFIFTDGAEMAEEYDLKNRELIGMKEGKINECRNLVLRSLCRPTYLPSKLCSFCLLSPEVKILIRLLLTLKRQRQSCDPQPLHPHLYHQLCILSMHVRKVKHKKYTIYMSIAVIDPY